MIEVGPVELKLLDGSPIPFERLLKFAPNLFNLRFNDYYVVVTTREEANQLAMSLVAETATKEGKITVVENEEPTVNLVCTARFTGTLEDFIVRIFW